MILSNQQEKHARKAAQHENNHAHGQVFARGSRREKGRYGACEDVELCSKAHKRYARHLVEVYGWDARMAIQRVYIFGYDFMPYSYKEKRPIMETRTKKSFGF